MAAPDLDVKDFTAGTAVTVKGYDLGSSVVALGHIGGHPGTVVRSHIVSDSDGAQTDLALATVAAGSQIVVTSLWVMAGANCTANLRIRVGLGTANVPTPAKAGVAGLIVDGTFGPGGGIRVGDGSGIIAIGADDEDLRLTCDDPVGGNVFVGYSYFTV